MSFQEGHDWFAAKVKSNGAGPRYRDKSEDFPAIANFALGVDEDSFQGRVPLGCDVRTKGHT